MALIQVWPKPGLTVLNTYGVPYVAGEFVEDTREVLRLVRFGDLLLSDPGATPVPEPLLSSEFGPALLVSQLQTFSGHYDGHRVRCIGFTFPGDGGSGGFRWDAASELDADGYTCLGTGTGRWIRSFDGEVVTPIAFGAVGGATQVNNAAVGTDDTAALQRFLDYVAENNCRNVEWSGSFKISATLVGSWQLAGSRVVNCNFKLFAASEWITEGDMLLLSNAQYVHFAGRIELWGNTTTSSGSTWSTRRTGNGLVLTGSGRSKFDFLRLKNFKYWGVRLRGDGNSSMTDLGHILAHDCGQWQLSSSGAQVVSFTVVSLAGSANSTNQRTVLSVPTLPPDEGWDDSTDGYDNTLCVIDGNMYLIEDRDDVAGTITIYPWLTIGGTIVTPSQTGSLSYITGGAVDIQGGDCNVVKIDLIDAIRCGIGLWSRAVYGCHVQRLVTQVCTLALAIGRSMTSANMTTVLDYAYFEANQYDIVQITTDNIGTYIRGTINLQLAKCKMIAWPMTNEGVREHTKFNGLNIQSREAGELFWDQRADTGETLAPNITLWNYQKPLTLYGDTKFRDDPGPVYLGITLKRGNESVQTLWGLDVMQLVGYGTGARGQPTGMYRFRCEAGFTVNGVDGSTPSARGVEFSGFTYPPLFTCKLVGTNWIVSCSQQEMPLAASVSNVDPDSLAAGAVSSISTVTVSGASLGDFVDVSFSLNLQGVVIDAWVSATDVVSYQFRNPTAGAVDLGNGTLRFRVRKGA